MENTERNLNSFAKRIFGVLAAVGAGLWGFEAATEAGFGLLGKALVTMFSAVVGKKVNDIIWA